MVRPECSYPEILFGGFSRVDGTIAFYTRVRSLVGPKAVILDVGCGRGEYNEDAVPFRRDIRIFRGSCARVIGLDVDEASRQNPFLDEFKLLSGERWPLEDESVDICISDNVLEHIEHPNLFIAEAHRVLRKGGVLCIRTPNTWSYFGIASRLTPNRLHAKVLRHVQKIRMEKDIFWTYYRLNNAYTIKRTLSAYGFESAIYGYESEPNYLLFSSIIYKVGVWIHRIIPGVFATTLFAFGRKR